MSIQGLMQKGTNNCSWLEKTADALLTFPRGLWLNREIAVIPGGDTPSLDVGPNRDQYKILGSPLCIIAYVAYILATPFLVVGLLCKKIALLNDPKANAYHNIIELSPKGLELLRQKENLEREKIIIEETLKNIDLKLEGLVIIDEMTPEAKNVIRHQRTIQTSAKLIRENRLTTLAQEMRDIEVQLTPIHQRVMNEFNKFQNG